VALDGAVGATQLGIDRERVELALRGTSSGKSEQTQT
jgi:hypothetical protein